MLGLHLCHQLFSFPHLLVNQLSMIEIKGEGSVDGRQRKLWKISNDLFRGLSSEFVPDVNVLDPNARVGNPWFAPANLWGADNVFANYGKCGGCSLVHVVILPWRNDFDQG